ncbi:hypothetical protein ANO14919_136680 [Xylariales sp. No.14919]|nr:hypothetical protein ANO14919_136680 [Xylariales sp. No.14919]
MTALEMVYDSMTELPWEVGTSGVDREFQWWSEPDWLHQLALWIPALFMMQTLKPSHSLVTYPTQIIEGT